MTTKREKDEHEAAYEMLVIASLKEGCMCEGCRTKREFGAALIAYQIIYPELPFVPTVYTERYTAGRLPRHNISMIRNLLVNNKLRIELEEIKDKSKPLHFCRHCGNLTTAKDSKAVNGDRYCNNCLVSLCECHHCGEMHRQRDCYTGQSADGQFKVCQSCRPYYAKCGSCGSLILKKETMRVKYGRSETGELQYQTLCVKCAVETAITCDQCGDKTYPGIGTTRNGYKYCPVCVEESKGIDHYYYKPLKPRFRKGKGEGKVTKNAFHMGFELEVAEHHPLLGRDTVVQLVKEQVGRQNVYVMSDGSISSAANSEGAEFASHPFTWQYYKKQGYVHWDKLCLRLRDYGWKGNISGLGIHIHTTKAAWGTHQIYKLLQFVMNERTKVQFVAQRGPTIYNNYDYIDSKSNSQVAKEKKQNGGHGHYQCINLNQGETGQASKTIEFRMFQSTLEPLYFHKNIEFVYALWKFTQLHSLKQMGWRAFTEYLNSNKREYPCLIEFIKMKGIK